MSVYGYVRVSSSEQARSGLSLAEQRKQISEYATSKGLGSIPTIFEDAGVSGGVDLSKREQGKALLKIIKKGDVVVITKLDRAFRKASNCLNTVEDFKKRGVSLHVIDLNGDVSGNGISALFLGIMASVAQFERSIISERQRDAKRQMAQQMRYLGGRRKSGTKIVKGEDGKQYVKSDAREQRAIAFIHKNAELTLETLRSKLKTLKGGEVDWNLMRISRIRRESAKYQGS